MATAEFDWTGFQMLLSDVGQLVMELKYVDDAHDFLMSDGQQGPWPLVEHTLGRTEPFSVYSTPQPSETLDTENLPGLSDVQEIARLQELASQASTWGYAGMADVRERCDLVVKPVVEDYTNTAELLTDLAQKLEDDNRAAEGDEDFGLDLSRWEGNAALAFQRGFVGPFSSVRENHRLALARSAACVGAGRAVVIGGQNSLMNLMTTYKETLREQLGNRAARNRGAVISGETLTVISTGLSIVGTLAGATGAGAGVGVALGLTSTALGYAAGQIPPEDTSLKNIKVAEAEEVMSGLIASVMSIRATYLTDWISIGYQAKAVKSNVEADVADGVLYPPRPSVDGAGPDGFHHGSSQQY